jgi:phosphodiesterase/alkaline phosphatase D-like protein
VVRLTIEGLSPATTYHWAVEVDGTLDRVRTGRITTMPVGPASFTLVAAACARSGSNAVVFDVIGEAEPLAYLQLGDLHYANIGTDDPGRFQAALQQVLRAPGQSALYRSTSIAYVWDDHDYSANDGNAASPSRPAAEAVYRAWVPYHPLVSHAADGPIGQSFVAGRLRVVMTDSRSQRTPYGTATGEAQQMLGAEQEAWFAAELAAAREAGQVVLWAASTPWIGEAGTSEDTWAGYPDARRRAADLIAGAGMQDRLVYVAGDAHMVALDDGSHTDYSTDRAGGFPLLQAAALDRPGSVKGGPYSGGTFPGGGQYGEVEVSDDGGPNLVITLRGRTWDGRTLVEQAFTLPAG